MMDALEAANDILAMEPEYRTKHELLLARAYLELADRADRTPPPDAELDALVSELRAWHLNGPGYCPHCGGWEDDCETIRSAEAITTLRATLAASEKRESELHVIANDHNKARLAVMSELRAERAAREAAEADNAALLDALEEAGSRAIQRDEQWLDDLKADDHPGARLLAELTDLRSFHETVKSFKDQDTYADGWSGTRWHRSVTAALERLAARSSARETSVS